MGLFLELLTTNLQNCCSQLLFLGTSCGTDCHVSTIFSPSFWSFCHCLLHISASFPINALSLHQLWAQTVSYVTMHAQDYSISMTSEVWNVSYFTSHAPDLRYQYGAGDVKCEISERWSMTRHNQIAFIFRETICYLVPYHYLKIFSSACVCVTEVGCLGGRTRLMMRAHLLYFVLHGMITSGHMGRNRGAVAVAASGCNQGVAAEANAIVKRQLKPMPLWSGSWSQHNRGEVAVYKFHLTGPFWVSPVAQSSSMKLLDSPKWCKNAFSSLFQCRREANHTHFRLLC